MYRTHEIGAFHRIQPPTPHRRRRSPPDQIGRMFPDLPPAYVSSSVLADIGKAGGPMDGGSQSDPSASVAVGQIVFGQFVDNDLTIAITADFAQPEGRGPELAQGRPRLDLSSVYGAGPDAQPYLYQSAGKFGDAKLLTGADEAGADAITAEDLLRVPRAPGGGRGRAIIGNPRNDEHRMISQMHLGMVRFHNKICIDIGAAMGLEGRPLFDEARRRTIWQYQWAVVNDFLVQICGAPVVTGVLAGGRQFFRPAEPFIPVEFSAAAFQFAPSMMPATVAVQKDGGSHALRGSVLGEGFSPLTSADAVVDWRELLFTPGQGEVQTAGRLTTRLPAHLMAAHEGSFGTRTLLRGNTLRLPAGDKVAAAMSRADDEIAAVMARVDEVSSGRITAGSPLWLYVLAEAEVIGRETTPGHYDRGDGLGPVGGRIVAEVIIGLLELDDTSYLGQNRGWAPHPDYDTVGKILTAT